ncbi:hypothetical protein [Nocardia jinanensis]|uniref:Uncharacterized protein n=1 Tax=Nocardia jinanensis TaxID=382504 RepID=A0A917VX26_9NOCA|nr:hypothetical protein [Nocardia jinanensis]GGL25250.1 hypothetical protein GCM10011588_45150 [Nocardia jinanensis]
MSYPYGQPPQQPAYPAQYPPPGPAYPAPAPGYPPAGYPPAGGYGHQPAPSGGTGITAGILALLGGVASSLSAVGMFILAAATSESSLTNGAVLATGARRRSSSSSNSSSSDTDIDFDFDLAGTGVVLGIAYSILALVLLIGGIMLLRRSNTGRVMVILGCVLSIVLTVVVVGVVTAGGGVSVLTAPLFALLTLVLAAIAPTKRWIEAARAPLPAGGYGVAPYGYR